MRQISCSLVLIESLFKTQYATNLRSATIAAERSRMTRNQSLRHCVYSRYAGLRMQLFKRFYQLSRRAGQDRDTHELERDLGKA